MPNLTVRNIPEEDYSELQQEARENRRSVNAEVLKAIAERAEARRRRRQADRAMRELDRLREEISKKYPDAPESVELIREIRDTR
jgi:plasmid stability protein